MSRPGFAAEPRYGDPPDVRRRLVQLRQDRADDGERALEFQRRFWVELSAAYADRSSGVPWDIFRDRMDGHMDVIRLLAPEIGREYDAAGAIGRVLRSFAATQGVRT